MGRSAPAVQTRDGILWRGSTEQRQWPKLSESHVYAGGHERRGGSHASVMSCHGRGMQAKCENHDMLGGRRHHTMLQRRKGGHIHIACHGMGKNITVMSMHIRI